MSFSAISTAKSALKNFVKLDSGGSWEDNCITRFMKGIFNLRTPLPKYSFTWDVDKVLNYLALLSPLKEINLKELTLKCCMLIALTSGHRAQSIHELDLKNCVDSGNIMSFHFTTPLKHSKPGTNTLIHIHKFESNHDLCVYSTLQEYIIRTQELRSSTKLWIAYKKPHSPISRQTISRWIKSVLQSSGIDIKMFGGHSTRMASASKAANVGIGLQAILNTCSWTSSGNFRKHYERSIINNNADEYMQGIMSQK